MHKVTCTYVTVIVKSVLSQSRISSGSNRTTVFKTMFNCSHAVGYELNATRFEMYCLSQSYMNFSESLLVNIFWVSQTKYSICVPKIIQLLNVCPQNYICHAYLMS